jgi:hypothetical protein
LKEEEPPGVDDIEEEDKDGAEYEGRPIGDPLPFKELAVIVLGAVTVGVSVVPRIGPLDEMFLAGEFPVGVG